MRIFQPFCLFLVGLFLSLLIIGCQSRPTPTPQPTPTENVVVVVITSTTQPTLAPTETLEATITPLATFTPIGLNSPTPTRRATATPAPIRTIGATNTPKAVASATPVPPTATPLPDKYSAPLGISPTTGDSNSEGAEIQFKYLAVGPLRGNECYLLHVQMVSASGNVPPAGDDFLDTKNCASQSPPGTRLVFVLNRPKFGSPTFGGIEQLAQNLGATVPFRLQWYVRVVQNNGFGPDGVHYNTIPLSSNSATLESEFWP
jgi:hypothetical protein